MIDDLATASPSRTGKSPPQRRYLAMREMTPPVPHRADVHLEGHDDLPGVPPLQRQQDRSCPVGLAALLRFRQGPQCGWFFIIGREFRFPQHAWLPQPSYRENSPFIT
jgi:hypothetical protein